VSTPELAKAGGSAPTSRLDHVGWLVGRGIPWLWRRGRDLVPYATGVMLRAALHLD
jgi:hypothetical protein